MAVNATIDNRTGLPDAQIQGYCEDRWVELAGLQFAQPNNFTLYGTTNQGSMLARTPFRTPSNVIEEIKLARSVADSDDDVAAALGNMLAIAYGSGLMNQHRDEATLEFFNQIGNPKNMDLEATFEELHREYLIAGSVTSLSLFMRQRMSYYPLKAVEPVMAQLQIPRIGILPAENIRVISNDIVNEGELAYHVEDPNMKNWLEEFFSPRTPDLRRSMMAQQEPVAANLFTGRVEIPYNDGDPASRGLIVYTLNQRMVHRTTMPKGPYPYARPLLTRNFPLLEAKRLLNIMDYALLQGGTNYIVIAKKGSDQQPAQPGEIQNLQNQIMHASRSGVLVGDHRLDIQIVTPNLEELLNPAKRTLLGRKISMGLLRQTEQVTRESGTKGAENEMEMLARVVTADRRKMIRHGESAFYEETALRNRSTFKEGAPTIWGPPIVLTEIKEFWKAILSLSDRGLIPHRYAIEALGYDYDGTLAERERELARDDQISLIPGKIPYGTQGEPQDNNEGRPPGSSSNNGTGNEEEQTPTPAKRVIRKTKGETIKAMVENGKVAFIGETTRALLAEYEDRMDLGYVTGVEREAIDCNQIIRSGSTVVVPVNPDMVCTEYRAAKLDAGLRVVIGQRHVDGALVAKALRFSEPDFDLLRASEYAIRWGFLTEPLLEVAGKPKRCMNCGNELPDYSPMNTVCPDCGVDNTNAAPIESGPISGGSIETGKILAELFKAAGEGNKDIADILRKITEHSFGEGVEGDPPVEYPQGICPECGQIQLLSNDACERCGTDMQQPMKNMLAYLEQRGVTMIPLKEKPKLGEQADRRKDPKAWDAKDGDTLLHDWARAYRKEKETQ
jgi:predicted RNA-binding Zn-ribbon protein involved in translation (DUF1610 family)